jgi:2-polyprenyl-3-methyl-5-hydroxy-6-metoxy-1,4-benzoquinol methylase
MEKSQTCDDSRKTVLCPLTRSSDVSLVRTIPAHELIRRWKSGMRMDISNELSGIEQIDMLYSALADFMFFSPSTVAGSGWLYAQLAQFPWYYMPDKWEHAYAAERLSSCGRVLEVGCGQGEFLQRLQSKGCPYVEGVELNAAAAQSAREKGFVAHSQPLEDFSVGHAGRFDAVCAFQVLEHIADPISFLEAAISLLQPGGLLLLSVPNADSYLQLESWNLLDLPPHHMSRWTEKTFRWVARQFSLELISVKTEPLASYHASAYVTAKLSKYLRVRELARMGGRLGGALLRSVPVLRHQLTGHTLLVELRKS